jgi:hypothetical protein
MSRIRSRFTSALLISAATCAMGAVASVQQPVASPKHVETRPAAAIGKPESRVEGNAVLQDAAGAAVVAAIKEQFGKRTVTVKLDSAEVEIASIRDRVVSGRGRVQIGEGEEWIAFRYRTLYDTLEGSAGYPQVTLAAGGTAERQVPTDPTLVRELDARLATELGREFAAQSARMRLDRVSTLQSGSRYQRVAATGVVDFGPEGMTPAVVDALYDVRARAWIRVNYELGPAATFEASERLAGN